ncbi:MAG: hypothetical protein DGJ47_001067 [Rickettsiaceae bacterium]
MNKSIIYVTDKLSNICDQQEDKAFKLQRKSQLYKIITNRNNTPDYLAINIYFDTLRSWYVPKAIQHANGNVTKVQKLKTKGVYLRYSKLAEDYSCSAETIRKKLVKLEQLGLIQRSFQHKEKASYNQLIVYVWKNTPLFHNEFGLDKEILPKLNPQTNHEYIQNKYNITYSNTVNNTIVGQGGIHTQEDTKELTNSFSKEKDRSIISNLKEKKLIDYYPLTKNDNNLLQKESGRDFSLNAMNEILLSMAKRLANHSFKTKKAFMNYMSKVFKFEMRDTVKVSGINFKINSNHESHQYEKYLSDIENHISTSPEWRFKKKIAAVLNSNIAYAIVKSCHNLKIQNKTVTFKLKQPCSISPLEEGVILEQVKSIYEYEHKIINAIKIIQPTNKKQDKTIKSITSFPENIWGRVRKLFIDKEGVDGANIDKNWLNRLEANIDENQKKLTLKAPSDFFRNWIETNYGHIIEKLTAQLGFQFAGYE